MQIVTSFLHSLLSTSKTVCRPSKSGFKKRCHLSASHRHLQSHCMVVDLLEQGIVIQSAIVRHGNLGRRNHHGLAKAKKLPIFQGDAIHLHLVPCRCGSMSLPTWLKCAPCHHAGHANQLVTVTFWTHREWILWGGTKQNPVVGLPQATHGCWRDRAGSGSGRIDHANAAHASRSQSRRPRQTLWVTAGVSSLPLQGASQESSPVSRYHWRHGGKRCHEIRDPTAEGKQLSPLERSFWTQRTFDTTILYPLVKTQLVATTKVKRWKARSDTQPGTLRRPSPICLN